MVVSDDNTSILWGESLADQLQSWPTDQWEYPSYDQNRSDSWKTMLFSDVDKPQEQPQGVVQPQASEAPQPTSDEISDSEADSERASLQQPQAQPQGPMKITEEALAAENTKIQEEQEQAQAAAMADLQEEPIAEEQSPEAALDSALADDSFNEWQNLLDDSQDTLGGFRINEQPYKVKRYNTGFLLASLGTLIFWWLSYLLYLWYQYLEYKSQPTIPTEKVTQVNDFSEKYDEYWEKIGLFDLEKFRDLDLTVNPERSEDLLRDADLNFVQKKDNLQFALTRLWTNIINLRNETRELREQMNRDWFFPQELVNILDADNAVDSIQRSLNSLEVVKFSSAIRVFSLMDDIVKDLADSFWFTRSDIKRRLTDLMERWEKDVEYYLNVCYNNPYEPEECNKINDFDKYYKKIIWETTFDTTFFKNLMKFINNQLEYNTMPSFSITFNSFDGQSNSISFSVEVNTTIEDETALIQQGIKSPHIFIISELIKLLKQSTFIVGKAIDAKDIKVVSKPITVAWRQFNVNNSVNTFTLPIQKTTDREIFDFVENYISTIQNTSVSDMISSLLNTDEESWDTDNKNEATDEEHQEENTEEESEDSYLTE